MVIFPFNFFYLCLYLVPLTTMKFGHKFIETEFILTSIETRIETEYKVKYKDPLWNLLISKRRLSQKIIIVIDR